MRLCTHKHCCLASRIYIPLPDAEGRAAILKHLISGQPHSLHSRDVGAIIQATEGYSASDLTALSEYLFASSSSGSLFVCIECTAHSSTLRDSNQRSAVPASLWLLFQPPVTLFMCMYCTSYRHPLKDEHTLQVAVRLN